MAMMAPKAGTGLRRPSADINVTPLVDVMLVLLIIFMVTAPMLASGMKIILPQAKQVQPLDPKAPVIITVGKDGSINLGPDQINRDKLIEAVTQKLGGDITQVIHLRGDKEASYGDVVAIMDQLATNGLIHIAIVADPHSKKDEADKRGSGAVNETPASPSKNSDGALADPRQPATGDGPADAPAAQSTLRPSQSKPSVAGSSSTPPASDAARP